MRVSVRPSDEIAAAFAVLTRVPVRTSSRDATGAAAYGLVGAGVGVVGGLAMVTLGHASASLAAVLAVGLMAVASGAFHLDGLADTTDALLARDAAQAEVARKDPAIGSGGVVTLILVLGTQVTALATLAGVAGDRGPLVAGIACVAAGAVSRALPAVVVLLRGDVVSRVGLGAWFAERVRPVDGAIATLTASVVAAGATWMVGAIAFGAAVAVGAIAGLAIGLSLVRARRQVDGDVLGATVELGFAATVATVAIAMAVTWPAV
jgi:adenosylcobinamide-GDP ribazoletransferase